MKFPRPRLTVRSTMVLVAVAALAAWTWRTYFDPVRLWQAAIRDKYDANSRWERIDDAAQGKVQGLEPELAMAELVGLLGDKRLDQQVRSTAASGLGRFKEKARPSIPALVAALRDELPAVRITSVVAIRQILGDHPPEDAIRREAVAGLVAALDDPDRRVRHWSACTLGFIGEGKRAIPALIAAWKAPNLHYGERLQILNALGRSGPDAAQALPVLLETARTASVDDGGKGGETGRQGNAEALIATARFLNNFGKTKEAIVTLRKLANDRDPAIAGSARKALKAIEPVPPTRPIKEPSP